MTAQDTSGPWECRGEYGLEIWEREVDDENEGEDAGWYSVATIHEPGEANARLIAAAPEMRVALHKILRKQAYPSPFYKWVKEVIRAAIAKAEEGS